jgi:hypothetical protein
MAKSTKHPNPDITRVLSEIQNELKAAGLKPVRTWNSVKIGDSHLSDPRLTIEVKYDLRSVATMNFYRLDFYLSLTGASHSSEAGDFGKILRIARDGMYLAELAAKLAEKYGALRWPVGE